MCVNCASTGLCGGCRVTGIPTATHAAFHGGILSLARNARKNAVMGREARHAASRSEPGSAGKEIVLDRFLGFVLTIFTNGGIGTRRSAGISGVGPGAQI